MSPAVIVRLPNWLGDTVMAVPAVRAVRALWSEARVVLAGPWASVLAGQGLGDVLVDYPRAWSARLRAADSVRSLRGTVAVLLPNSFEAALAARYWGARRIVGFDVGGRSWLLTEALPLAEPRAHQVDEYLMLAEHLGAAAVSREPRLTPPDPESPARREVRALLHDAASAAVPAGGQRVGVHLGAAYGAAKVWPLARAVDFCRSAARHDLRPVLLGTPADSGAAAEIARAAPVLNMVGRDRPALLTALLAEMDALVCGDTGVGHLAAAMGTPVVALFGPTDPTLSAPRGPAAVVRHAVPCAPCFYRTCPIDHPCLGGVEPAEVWTQVHRALAAPDENTAGAQHSASGA
jgi:heptosyltransferase-2